MEEKATLDETLVNRALADQPWVFMVYYEVLEPHIQDDATINDDVDSDQSLDVEKQNEEFNSQEGGSYSITPSSQEAAASFSQESNPSSSMSRVSQEVLADKRRMEEWEKERKEEERMLEERRAAVERMLEEMIEEEERIDKEKRMLEKMLNEEEEERVNREMLETDMIVAEKVVRDMEERERDYRTLGFDVRLEEARFVKETKEQRSKVLKLVAEE